MPTLVTPVGKVIKARREKLRKTQVELEAASGISRATLSKVEQSIPCRRSTLEEICIALDMDVSLAISSCVDSNNDQRKGRDYYHFLQLRSEITRLAAKYRSDDAFDRVRVYSYDEPNERFLGLTQIGGDAVGFRGTQILLEDDPVSDLLVSQFRDGCVECLYYEKTNATPFLTVTGGNASTTKTRPIKEPPRDGSCLLPFNISSADRDGLKRWMELPIVAGNQLLGRVTLDCKSTDADERFRKKELNPGDPRIWQIASEMALKMAARNKLSHSPSSEYRNLNKTARRFVKLENRVVNCLNVIKRDDNEFAHRFDGIRAYLSFDTFNELFHGLYEPEIHKSGGFIGFTEIGGVDELMLDRRLFLNKDPCTEIMLRCTEARFMPYARELRLGNPVIFTGIENETRNPGDVECCVHSGYNSPTLTERILPEQQRLAPTPISEHMDLPIIHPEANLPCQPNDILAKLTFDAKWHYNPETDVSCHLGRFTNQQVERLKEYAKGLAKTLLKFMP